MSALAKRVKGELAELCLAAAELRSDATCLLASCKEAKKLSFILPILPSSALRGSESD